MLSSATLTGGTNAQASVAAFDNIYSGCGGTVPSTYWAYNTGGTAGTSVALSGNGSEVAFVQTEGTNAYLVLLKWKASATESASNPLTLTSQATAAAYHTCTAPCMYTIEFNGGANDTYSSPFYDFTIGSDTLYVGDDNGLLHKFTGVFNGSPTETV